MVLRDPHHIIYGSDLHGWLHLLRSDGPRKRNKLVETTTDDPDKFGTRSKVVRSPPATLTPPSSSRIVGDDPILLGATASPLKDESNSSGDEDDMSKEVIDKLFDVLEAQAEHHGEFQVTGRCAEVPYGTDCGSSGDATKHGGSAGHVSARPGCQQ